MSELPIHNLQTQIRDLEAQLDAVRSQSTTTAESAADSDVNEAIPHARSMDLVRELLWQGRCGLAFHLARSLELQNAAGPYFRSSIIRPWALSRDLDRRASDDALRLIDGLLSQPAPFGENADAEEMFRWATFVKLASSLSPTDLVRHGVRCAAPASLPETTAWWSSYLSAIHAHPEGTTTWLRLPDPDLALAELGRVTSQAGDLKRLAASCTMMAIRRATRRMRIGSRYDSRFVLNAELGRCSDITFAESDLPEQSPASVEAAIRELASQTAGRRKVVVSESAAPMRAVASLADESTESLLVSSPRAASTISRLNSLESSVQSALDEFVQTPTENASATQESLRLIRRDEARARLDRYAEKISPRPLADSLASAALIPISVAATPESSMLMPETPSLMGDSNSNPVLESFSGPVENARHTADAPPPSAPPLNEARYHHGIHASTVANAFGVEHHQNDGTPPPLPRRENRLGSWGSLMSPQSAVIAALILMATGIAAALGVGLRHQNNEPLTSPLASSTPATATAPENTEPDSDLGVPQ